MLFLSLSILRASLIIAFFSFLLVALLRLDLVRLDDSPASGRRVNLATLERRCVKNER